jgi:hypothetical protein
MTLKFVSTDQSMQAQHKFRKLLDQSVRGVQMAFAYFTKAGCALLQKHQSILKHDHSFLVISVDWPTDLDAVAEFASCYPGKVFLHLGWVAPSEKKVGPALMHSKLALGQSTDTWRLWVGSQNLTARAMVSGNTEAALVYEAVVMDQPILDAQEHLRRCRDGAEMFDSARLVEYKHIQKNKAFGVGIPGKLLVLYAEEVTPIAQFPAVVHVRIPNEDYDDLTQTGTEAHLIVVPPGTLRTGVTLPAGAKRYTGFVVEDNRTEFHGVRGSASTMPHATHWLEMGPIPKLVTPNSVVSRPLTQAAIKIDQRPELQQPAPADEFLYSVTATRVKVEAAATPERLSRRRVADEFLKFYSPSSKADGELLFAPREHLTEAGQVTIYSGTPIPPRFEEALERTRLSSRRGVVRERRITHTRRVELKVVERQPVNEADPFFFRSEFRVRSDDETFE